ncbi:MAG TPA: hypothetical protein VIU41_02865 [Geobacteraceae bacterium]
MKKNILVVTLVLAGTIAGCGGGGSSSSSAPSTTTISGTVADGYLAGAEVFLDKNGTYQWDGVEPRTITDANGAYSMTVSAADAANYPMVARVIAGTTIDKDTNTVVTNSYVMSAPAGAAGFISPMSTLIREKMAANPSMTLADAMTQLRNQMNLPAGMNMMADYVAGSQSGANAAQYQAMHTMAQQMAGLMAGEAGLVMSGSGVNVNRYRSMMGTINSNMSGIAANVMNGLGMNSTFMTSMMSSMQTQLGTVPMTGSFTNYSGMFRNMTSSRYFWSTSTGTTTPTTPMTGGMMM